MGCGGNCKCKQQREGWVIWFTGLSGSGKTTMAKELEAIIKESGNKCIWFDGDEIRKHVPSSGYDRKSRNDHISRVAYFASQFAREGYFVIVSLISPYEETRNLARNLTGNNFIEVYISTPLETCMQRDVKGLYSGKTELMTGVSDNYDIPQNPEITLDTSNSSIDDSVKELVDAINKI